MNEIQVFSNDEFGKVRVIEKDNQPWFVGKDVASALGYNDLGHAIIDHVDEQDRVNSKTQGQNDPEFGQRGTWLINESGLYSLILSSKLPSAKKFQRWVTSEVLPSLRQNGAYIVNQDELSPEELIAKALVAANKIIENKTKQIEEMKPKAEYFDALVDRKTNVSFTVAAKELGIHPKQLIQWLLDNKYLYRDANDRLLPYENKNKGLFVVKDCRSKHNGWSGFQTLITPKGKETFRLLMKLDK